LCRHCNANFWSLVEKNNNKRKNFKIEEIVIKNKQKQMFFNMKKRPRIFVVVVVFVVVSVVVVVVVFAFVVVFVYLKGPQEYPSIVVESDDRI
jgi:flagellar biosynthesis/type III secretory pathway M-ring protein FliF/YscJ